MRCLVFFQYGGRCEIPVPGPSGLDVLRKTMRTTNSQIKTMRGDRMHANRRITDEGNAAGDKFISMDAHKRIGVTFPDQFHAAQPVFQTQLNIGGKLLLIYAKYLVRHIG